MGRPRNPRVLAVVLAVAVVATACSGGGDAEVAPTAQPTATPTPLSAEETADVFLQAWADHDWAAMLPVTFAPAQQDVLLHQEVWADLGIEQTSIEGATVVVTGNDALVEFTVRARPQGMDPWVYDTSVSLLRTGDEWAVDWTSRTVHPALFDGRRLERVDEQPTRGRIVDHRGAPLRVERTAHEIGVVPGRLEDLADVAELLAETLEGVDAADVIADVDAPGVQPDWFIPVVTLSTTDWERVWPDLRPVPGVVVREISDRQSADDGLASHVLGSVGPITAEQLALWGAPYEAGDIVGHSGLELAYETELRGRPFAEIQLLESTGDLLSVLHSSGDAVPFVVTTTLDLVVQRAAEDALDQTELPAALVAIDVASGEIRAVASRPVDGFNRALGGLYPPGSTFKTVTATAAIADGATVATSVDCPPTVNAGGFLISNAGGSSLGTVSMETAYARSCNTAFAGIGLDVGGAAIAEAALSFGFDQPYSVGLETRGGSYPAPRDDAEVGASAIGQGRVQASPVHMASVAATVANGGWQQPILVTDPAPAQRIEVARLPAATADALRQMMRSVVTDGTGTAAQTTRAPVFGKTGSAEFGDEDPPRTHAWFIGYSGDLAVAVLVEGGGGGGSVAAPIAGAFFAALEG